VISEKKFYSKVKKMPSGCWEWQAYINRHGYGHLNVNGKTIHAHRMAWIYKNGEISGKILVCHKCDNPKCVNLDHLFLGTNQDNKNDAVNKKRHTFGERIHSSKLNAKQVISIFTSYKNLSSIKGLSVKHSVSIQCVYDIVNGVTWKHLNLIKES